MRILIIFIIFTKISLITNNEYISIRNLDEIEKGFNSTINDNDNTIFYFFLTTDIVITKVNPIIITHSMQLLSNFSKIYIKDVEKAQIFLIKRFISYFSLKNIDLIFDGEKMSVSILYFHRNIPKIRIESVQILAFHSNSSIFTFLNDHFFSDSMNIILRNLTMKNSIFLSIMRNIKTSYFQMNSEFKPERFLIMENILFYDCYIRKEIIEFDSFFSNYYFFFVKIIFCSFEESIFINRYRILPLNFKVFSFLIEDCIFSLKSIFIFEGTKEGSLILFDFFQVKNTNINKYIITTTILNSTRINTVFRIRNSEFLRINCQTSILNLRRTKVYLINLRFRLIENVSSLKRTLFQLMECPEINIYYNDVSSTSNFENTFLINSKIISSKIILFASNFSKIICLGTIIRMKYRKKIEFSALYNTFYNFSVQKFAYLEKNYNHTIGLLSITANSIEIIFKNNEVYFFKYFNNLLRMQGLYSNFLIQNNKYKEIEMIDLEFLAQNLYVIILSSLYSGYANILSENFIKFTFRFSIYYLNNFIAIISDVSFKSTLTSLDSFIITRWLMRCIDSIIFISNINQISYFLNLLVNLNSIVFIFNILIDSYKSYFSEFSFFVCVFCLFQIENIEFHKGAIDCQRCYFILILGSMKSKYNKVNNIFISETSIIFSIITAFMANINLANLSIMEYEYNNRIYPNIFLITEMTTKNALFFLYEEGKSGQEMYNFLTIFYFFSSNIKLNNSNFSNINMYENPLIKSEYCSISIENSNILCVYSLLESILSFINNNNTFLKNNQFRNNFENFGVIRIINELDAKNNAKFQIQNQEFYINDSLLILAIANYAKTYYNDILQMEFFRKYSNFIFQDLVKSRIYLISSNNIFNFMGSGIYHINDCYFNIITKSLAFNLFDVDQLLIVQCSFVTKQILSDKPHIYFYQNSFFNKSLIEVYSKVKYLRILDSFFEFSFGERGSVLYIFLPEKNIFQSRVEIFNSTFVNNSAIQEGGVFYFISSDLFFLIKNNLFYLNSAGTHGGVLYSESYGKIGGNTFFYNKAETSGGVIRWNKIEPIFECDDIVFKNNAEYGNYIASEPRYVILLNVSDSLHENKEFYDFYVKNKRQIDFKAVREEDCDKFRKNIDFGYFQLFSLNKTNITWTKDIKIVFGLYDLYYQLASVTHSFIFDIINLSPDDGIIKEKDFIKYDFNGFIILENLEFTFIKPRGIINFFIEKVPFFEGFESQSESLSKKMGLMLNFCFPEITFNHQKDYLTTKNQLQCILGEYFENSKCIRCPDNYYTLTPFTEFNYSNSSNCKKRPNLARISFGSVIVPYDGYWIEKGRDVIYECIYREACIYLKFDENLKENRIFYSTPLGTNCLLGFDGNLCGECRINTDLYKDQKCIDCEEMNDNIFFNSINIIIFFVFYEIMIFSAGKITYESENKIETPLFKILINMILSLEMLRKKITKMELANDLVIEKKYAFEFYDEIMKYLGTLAHPSKMVTFRCLANHFFYQQLYPYFKLISILTLPFLFLFFSLILFAFSLRGKKEMNLMFLISKGVNLISVIQFLFIYELIKIFFDFLNCIPFYDGSILKSFPNISCSDENYLLSRNFFVLPFSFFFVFAIPILSCVSIFRNQHTINTDMMIKKFGFIYLGYKPKLFFWEYAVYFKKISLIFFDVIYESNPFSIYYFFGSSVIYLFYHYKLVIYQPYKSQILFNMEVLSSYSSLLMLGFCTVFASLQRKSNDLELQLGKYFFHDYLFDFLNFFFIGALFFLMVVMMKFLKIFSTRYLAIIKNFIFNIRRKKKESSKNLNSFQLKKLLFLNYLNIFETNKKNILFLSHFSFQENLIHLTKKRILQVDVLKSNFFVENLVKKSFINQKFQNNGSFQTILKKPQRTFTKYIIKEYFIFMLQLREKINQSCSSIKKKKKTFGRMSI